MSNYAYKSSSPDRAPAPSESTPGKRDPRTKKRPFCGAGFGLAAWLVLGGVLVALAGVGCGGEGGGDSPDAATDPCFGHCGPHTTCLYRLCTPVFFPATYAITLLSASVPPTRSDGSPWDVDGLPDLYATVRFGATTLGSGDVIMNSITPTWNSRLPATVALTGSDILQFDVYDEDGATDELVFSCTKSVSQVIPFSTFSGNTFSYRCDSTPPPSASWLTFSLTAQ